MGSRVCCFIALQRILFSCIQLVVLLPARSMLGQGGIEFGRALFGLTPPAVPCENRRGLVYGPETAQ